MKKSKKLMLLSAMLVSSFAFTTVNTVQAQEPAQVITSSPRASIKKTPTTDIYKYDAGAGKHLTYINGKGYSQYVYLNKSGKYAFTPSSWMKAAGLNVSMPSAANGYKMSITNPYITYANQANQALTNYQNKKMTLAQLQAEYNKLDQHITSYVENPKLSTNKTNVTLTKDIYKYDGHNTHLTMIANKGYSQYTYLNASQKYAFTPSSWMKAAGLNVSMPTKSNGYRMVINNPYVLTFNTAMKKIKSTLSATPSQSPEEMVTAEMYRLVNDHRVNNGQPKLAISTKMENMATFKSEHMIKNNYFEHRPGGLWIWEQFPHLGTMGGWIGENIAQTPCGTLTTANAKQVALLMFTQWKNSSGHNKNMLHPNFKYIGFGFDIAPNGKMYGTQIFSSHN